VANHVAAETRDVAFSGVFAFHRTDGASLASYARKSLGGVMNKSIWKNMTLEDWTSSLSFCILHAHFARLPGYRFF
jgi:hypothetical protein